MHVVSNNSMPSFFVLYLYCGIDPEYLEMLQLEFRITGEIYIQNVKTTQKKLFLYISTANMLFNLKKKKTSKTKQKLLYKDGIKNNDHSFFLQKKPCLNDS